MDPGIFKSDPDKALDLSQKRGETEKVIEELEDNWLMALEAYEEAKAGKRPAHDQ